MRQGYYCQLPHRAVLRVRGADATHFLQDSITNDITKASETSAIYAALLTPQGKFLFDFFIIKSADGYLFDCEAQRIDALIERLNFYKLRADVIFEKEALKVYAIWEAKEPIAMDICFADTRDNTIGFRALSEVAPPELTRASLEDYHARRIARVIAEAGVELTPERFPLECNLDYLNAIDFHKGCYTGQEVTSRMKRRGKGGRKRLVGVARAGLSLGEMRVDKAKVGEVLSVVGDRGLALVRLDRLAEHLAALTTQGFALENLPESLVD